MFYKTICLFSFFAVIYSAYGDDAKPGEFPQQVLLQVDPDSSQAEEPFVTPHTCEGVILDKKWILTAATCLSKLEGDKIFPSSEESILVMAGKYRLDLPENTEQISTVKTYFKHPQYSVGPRFLPVYDIGLIKLSSPLKLNSHVAAAALPMANTEPTGEYVSAGWNLTFKGNTPVMQKMKTTVIDYKTCNRMYEKLKANFGIKGNIGWTGEKDRQKNVLEYNFCTETSNDDEFNNCYGSGNALLSKRKDGTVEVVGLRSWYYTLFSCSQNEAPPVYTKVSSFIDWIVKTMTANV